MSEYLVCRQMTEKWHFMQSLSSSAIAMKSKAMSIKQVAVEDRSKMADSVQKSTETMPSEAMVPAANADMTTPDQKHNNTRTIGRNSTENERKTRLRTIKAPSVTRKCASREVTPNSKDVSQTETSEVPCKTRKCTPTETNPSNKLEKRSRLQKLPAPSVVRKCASREVTPNKLCTDPAPSDRCASKQKTPESKDTSSQLTVKRTSLPKRKSDQSEDVIAPKRRKEGPSQDKHDAPGNI